MSNSISDIRQEFINFFKKKEHQVISSSSLVPANDPTLLFTNSGMNQFKNIFLGVEKPVFKRIVTIQRCMRAGGKHNDLENVGYTDRHLTFFEMLGNFSFGDYFKNDAIQFAWELLTSNNWFNLSKDKIWVTTHVSDSESYDIWSKNIGLSNKHIIKIGYNKNRVDDSDNFWQMGKFGPCGMCSEIFYDRGNNFCGTPPNNTKFVGERYIEIWNLVFVQFNRQADGKLLELAVPSVDTGMGLERITAVLQNVPNNYAIDVFKNFIITVSQILQIGTIIDNRSIYVIVDHIRACVFLIRDGVLPSNEGRGYVLRRIIRRAVCHGKKLGVNYTFLHKLVKPLIIHMQYISDVLYDKKDFIKKILLNEEELFKNTLQKGLELLEIELMRLKDKKILSGSIAFRLYSTYGFPLELTKDICETRNVQVDQLIFDKMMLEERKNSKKSNRFGALSYNIGLPLNTFSTFVGYKYLSFESKVIKLLQNNELVHTIGIDQDSIVILDFTPFYGESGGQLGDIGYLKTKNAIFKVMNTTLHGSIILHQGLIIQGIISIGDQVYAEIDQVRRKKICLNHSATHLLNESLMEILGSNVTQQGSLVNDEYLRFDFSYYNALTENQINAVENLVNKQIWNNVLITEHIMSIEAAQDIGAKMLLHKQYNSTVRVLKMGNFSIELCGGTHAKTTGEIGLFIITKETGIGSGIRRIEAVTKDIALSIIQNKKHLIQNIIRTVHCDDKTVFKKVYELKHCYNKLKKTVKNLKIEQEIRNSLSDVKNICYIKNTPVFIKTINDIEQSSLFHIISYLKSHIKSGIIVLMSAKNGMIHYIIVSVTQDLIKINRINALNLVQNIVRNFGGKSGGKSNFAQAKINSVMKESDVIMNINILL